MLFSQEKDKFPNDKKMPSIFALFNNTSIWICEYKHKHTIPVMSSTLLNTFKFAPELELGRRNVLTVLSLIQINRHGKGEN